MAGAANPASSSLGALTEAPTTDFRLGAATESSITREENGLGGAGELGRPLRRRRRKSAATNAATTTNAPAAQTTAVKTFVPIAAVLPVGEKVVESAAELESVRVAHSPELCSKA